jgi:hypothetical protein
MEGEEQIPGTENITSREEMIEQELAKWWSEKDEYVLVQTIHKAVRYGSNSLELVGYPLALQVPSSKRSRQVALQMACVMYAFGKLSRAWAALLRGEQPNEDDYFDAGVYCRMAMRIMETGEWVS